LRKKRRDDTVCTDVHVAVVHRIHKISAFVPAEEAQKSVKGLEENAIHNKYIELVISWTISLTMSC
jgi:hypothetical protein